MNAESMKALRSRHDWTQEDLAQRLNAALDRKYTGTEIGRWERGVRPLPGPVASFLEQLEIEAAFPAAEQDGQPSDDLLDLPSTSRRGEPEDSAPLPPGGAAAPVSTSGQNPLPGGGAYARVCEELWEMVATGVGLVGAATGSEALRKDGEIIHADKEALGRAYGKLAETNATFRRMLAGVTTSGAWLEVAMVSGITAGKVLRSHQAISEQRRAALAAAPEEQEVVDGGGVPLVGLTASA